MTKLEVQGAWMTASQDESTLLEAIVKSFLTRLSNCQLEKLHQNGMRILVIIWFNFAVLVFE